MTLDNSCRLPVDGRDFFISPSDFPESAHGPGIRLVLYALLRGHAAGLTGKDGLYLGDHRPWKGTAADLLVQAQFALHSGRILGLLGRILISVMDLVQRSYSHECRRLVENASRLRQTGAAKRLSLPAMNGKIVRDQTGSHGMTREGYR